MKFLLLTVDDDCEVRKLGFIEGSSKESALGALSRSGRGLVWWEYPKGAGLEISFDGRPISLKEVDERDNLTDLREIQSTSHLREELSSIPWCSPK